MPSLAALERALRLLATIGVIRQKSEQSEVLETAIAGARWFLST